MTHRTKLFRAAAAIGLIVALSLTGCTASPKDDVKTVLRFGVVTALTSFAPWQAAWGNESPYLQAVYDTLLRADPDGKPAAGIATEWTWDDSRTVLTLRLRDDVVFSDGAKLTASVAAENLIRFRDGTSADAGQVAGMTGAKAPDATTLVITLASPDPAFLVYLSQNAGLVASPAMFDSADAQTTPIGSGPYLLNKDKTVVGSTYVFDANPKYWDLSSVHYSEIDMTYYADPTALTNAVKGGQVDVANTTSATQIPEAQAAGFSALTSEYTWVGFLLFDRNGAVNPAFADVQVRQAFNFALDRKGLLQALSGGNGSITTQVFAPEAPGYDKALDSYYDYDPENAKSLLAKAGHPDGVDIVMPSNSFVPESQFAIYKEQLAAGGFNVTWEQTGSDLFGRMLQGTWAVAPFQLGSYPTAWQTIQFSMLPTSTWNPFHVEDATVQKLANTVQTSSDEAEALAAARDLNRYVVEQAWYAPINTVTSAFLANAATEVKLQAGNAVPYLWNIRPSN